MKRLIFGIGLFLFLYSSSFVFARMGGGEDGGMQQDQMMKMSQTMAAGKVSVEQMKHMQNRMTKIQNKLSGLGMQK